MNPRQGFKFFRFFVLDINCLQTVPSKTEPSLLRKDPNPRNAKKRFFEMDSLSRQKDSNQRIPNIAPLKTKKKPRQQNRGKFFQVKLPDKLEFMDAKQILDWGTQILLSIRLPEIQIFCTVPLVQSLFHHFHETLTP